MRRNADGSYVPNPFFGRRFIESSAQNSSGGTGINIYDQQRVSVAYELNFTERKGWMKWLGRYNTAALAAIASVVLVSLSRAGEPAQVVAEPASQLCNRVAAGLRSVLLQKRNGAFHLALWRLVILEIAVAADQRR